MLGFVLAAVEDVIELGNGIAAFDADWHRLRLSERGTHDFAGRVQKN